ncbi:unnamed protein product [Leptosia nina]|uniref:EGF-like domain-containing protein n=1 Tax=Leptosia nina TaxID=320188 RepID=A0AAV1J3S0_9NEOP
MGMAVNVILLCFLAATSAQFIDEFQEFNVECLGEGVFECRSGECIFQERICDGNYDCNDGSDENFCVNQKPDSKYCNETHQFLCRDGNKCIPNTWVCNEDPDCDDQSDEWNCTVVVIAPNATCMGFQCDGSKCISKFWMCDGVYDCEDKSDEDIERTCRHALHPRRVNNGQDCKSEVVGLYEKEYSCLDTSFCLPKDNMCDGIKDCKDGSDEGTFCQHWQTMCSNFSCNGTKCVPDRTGPYCDCLSSHYKYNYTTQVCENINNCLDDVPWCSHRCERVGTAFRCLCEPGYVMDSARYLCYAPDPEAMLFFSTRNAISYIKVKSKEQRVIASGIKQAHGVTYDGAYVYWVETADGHQAIVRALITNVQETKEVIVALGLEDPGDIALDWLGGNIYFTDVERGIIGVCKTDGSVCSVLHAKTKNPRYVTLDPVNGQMYWADWQERALILTSRMDGSDGKAEILVDNLGHLRPTGLTLDSPNQRMYFVDGTIKVVKLFDRKVYSLFEEPHHQPYSISVFENTVYWSDWTSGTIQTADKLHSSEKRDLLANLKEPVFAIPEYRPQHLVVGSGSLFTRIQYSALGNPETHATHFDIGRVQAMAYDNRRDTLYLYDGHRKSINYINMSDFTLGVTHLVSYVGFDNVVDMDYGKRLVIAVAESELNNEIHIDSIGLDGNDRKHVLTNNLLGPNIRLRYSSEMDIIYVADEGSGVIDYLHPEGTGREHFRKFVTSLGSLAVTDTHVFWSDRHTQHLYWADVHKAGYKLRRMSLSIFSNKTFLHLQATTPPMHSTNPLLKHACNQNTTPCSHICVQVSHPVPQDLDMGYKCLCPVGLLQIDNKCEEIVSCKPYEHYCHRSNECFLSSKRCDGHNDCKFGEDEENCSPTTAITENPLCKFDEKWCNNTCINRNAICKTDEVTCSPTEDRCGDTSICIERSSICDGIIDCPDGSDELPAECDTLSCLQSEFMCSSGYCIPSTWRCDESMDCADGSDEINCVPRDKTCPEDFFQCGDSSCIKLIKRCDGNFDCSDASDENNCDASEILTDFIPSCHPWEFSCELNSSICLPLTARCNGKVECPGRTDEVGCDFHCAPKGMFPCKQELVCVTKRQLCNGRNDCADGSDETVEACEKANKNIPLKKISTPTTSCTNGFRCVNGECIEWEQVCDKVTNCQDGSDENGNCTNPCTELCPKFCRPTPQGPACVCPNGYKKNGNDCDDVDECLSDVCAQVCHNTPGSFVCSCHLGYSLRSDHRTCKALSGDTSILYSNGNSIWSVFAHRHFLEHTYFQNISITDLDYDFRNNKLYISVLESGEVIEINRNQNTSTTTAIGNIGWPTKISVDWITGNVYFVDATPDNIFIRVCNFAKKSCARLERMPSNSVVPALVVDPVHRLMFYCISQTNGSAVKSASLAGRDSANVAYVSNCTGLAIDSSAKKLYIFDSPGELWHVDYNGLHIAPLFKRNPHIQSPRSPTILEGYIYYLDGYKLNRCLLKGFQTCETYLYINATNFAIRRQSVEAENGCLNSACSNVCVLADFPNCVCGNGDLSGDGICADSKKIEDVAQAMVRLFLVGFGAAYRNTRTVQIASHQLCSGTSKSKSLLYKIFHPEDQQPLITVLPLINGQVLQEVSSGKSVTSTLIIVVLVLFGIYLCVFLYYQIVKVRKNRRDNYVQVRYENRPGSDGVTRFTNSIIEIPTAGRTNHEFVNPLQYVRNIWNDSFQRTKPIATQELAFETQQNISDTESDIDINESKKLLRLR